MDGFAALRFAAPLASIVIAAGCTRSSGGNEKGGPPAVNSVAAVETRDAGAPSTATLNGRDDWPAWRGPNGDAVSTETDWTNDWPAGGPKQLWTASVGVGFSAVSVAGGRAYAMGHDSTEPEKEKEKLGDDTVWCLDAVTGSVIWKHSYPCKQVANLHEGGPSSTPAIDGNRVYTLSKEGHLFCFDATNGDVIWTVELQKLLDVEMPPWGFSGSPRVFDDKVILDAGPTVAFDKNTGKVAWKSKDHVVGYGSPTLFSVAGEPLVAVLNNQFLMVLRAKDGTLVDQAPWTSSFATSATTPVVEPANHGATIFISTGYDTGCALYDLTDGQLTQRYKNKHMRNHMATCVAWKDVLFGFDGNADSPPAPHVWLVALKRDTGEVLWKERGLGAGTLMRSGDRLILLSDDGRLVIAEASEKEYKPLATAEVLKGKCWTMPVLADGRIYCRDAAGDVVCVDVRMP
jgi:outer membrane protein assembly factor BamB